MLIPRRLLLALVTVLLSVACGAGSSGGTGSPDEGTAAGATAASTTEADGGSTPTGTSAPDEPTDTNQPALEPEHDRPDAPDFSLELADGTTFILSEEARPVYLVFWAEW